MRGGGTWTGLLLATLFVAHSTSADTLPGVDVRTWMPSTNPRASLVLEPVSSPGLWALGTAAWLHYENDSVVLRSALNGAVLARPLANALGLDLTASLGLGHGSALGLRLPMFLYDQGGGGLPATIVTAGRVPTSGFGDLALVGKGTLVTNDGGGLGLAALGSITAPTGASTSFDSDSAPVVTARLLGELSLRLVTIQASVGFALHTTHPEWPASSAGVVFGDDIPWTLGVLMRPAALRPIARLDPGGRQTWEVALHGSLPAGPEAPWDSGAAALRPVLLALSDRVGLGHFRDGFVLAGVDLGLDRAIGVPSVRVTLAAGWAFVGHDRDHDGIADDVDQCPEIAEDRDGFEDADGCPEVDNDDDGIIDSEDACPNKPGPPSPDPRNNGCPSEVSVTPDPLVAP